MAFAARKLVLVGHMSLPILFSVIIGGGELNLAY